MKSWESEEFKTGAVSAVIAIIATYPIGKLSIRQAMTGFSLCSTLKTLRSEGFLSLYRGIAPPLIQKTIAISMMFGVFKINQRMFQEMFPNAHPFIIYILSGVTSGLLESVMTPFERVQTLLTCPRHAAALNNMGSAMKYIYQYYPRKEFFRGWQAILLRNCVSTPLFFILRDLINSVIPIKNDNLRNFFNGAALGVFLTTFCFPINATRIHIQSELGNRHRNVFGAFSQLLSRRDRNIRKLYIGAGANALRSLISWGIINATHEFLIKNKYFCK